MDTDTCSYYGVLGVTPDSSTHQIKQAYRKLAMQWHPDRWTRSPSVLLSEAKRKFQEIQHAYSVLSDEKKRALYDLGLYDQSDDDDDDEGYSDFLQEMVSLIAQEKRQKKRGYYKMEELQQMFTDMAKGFQQTPVYKKGRNWEFDSQSNSPILGTN